MDGRVDETSVVDGETVKSYHDAGGGGAEEGPRGGADGSGRGEGRIYIYIRVVAG